MGAAASGRDAEGGDILLLRSAKWGHVGLAVAATLALAPAAWAHSTLDETQPPRDGIVQHSPKRVLMRFDEPVETALGSITVYDGQGDRVDAGKILRPKPSEVAVAIDRELERGTYTVAWRVISADSDPIKGAWVFHVKQPGAQPEGIAAQVLEDTPFVTSVFYLAGRALDFGLILASVGGVVALAFALRSASELIDRVVAPAYGDAGLDPAATLVVGVSKTFSTIETLTNLDAAIEWLREGGVDDPHGQVIAITADNRIVLVEQFRHAVERVTLEFPAGRAGGHARGSRRGQDGSRWRARSAA